MYSQKLRQAARTGCRAELFRCADVSRGCAETSEVSGVKNATNLRLQETAAGQPVSGLLFTGSGATVACDVQERGRLAGPRRACAYGERYSAIVFTTLEVGRVSPTAPPVALTALSTCSS